MSKYPSEIFGYPNYVRDQQATQVRDRHWCPFVDKVCYKQSRLIDYPFGVCSVHATGKDIAVCPRRFLDRHAVFTDIALHHFNTIHDILVFPEVGLEHVGSFDFVMVKHRPMSLEIEDFAVIEFQTGQTTGTGELVKGLKAFMAGEDVTYRSYNFGVNYYDIWKRTFTQVLNKGIILENWGRKIYWVIQEPVYAYFENRYNLQQLGFSAEHSTVFALYDLKRTAERFELVATRKISSTIDDLFAAFRNNPDIPPVGKFMATLEKKISAQAQISLSLGTTSRAPMLDVKPPTASGRIRETGDEEEGTE